MPAKLAALLGAAREDDEPTTPHEDEGVREARTEIARGEVFSAADVKLDLL